MKIINLITLLLISCSTESFLKKNGYTLTDNDIISSDGVYYTSTKYFDPVLKTQKTLFPFMKFNLDGTVIQGNRADMSQIEQMGKKHFDSLIKVYSGERERFTIVR